MHLGSRPSLSRKNGNSHDWRNAVPELPGMDSVPGGPVREVSRAQAGDCRIEFRGERGFARRCSASGVVCERGSKCGFQLCWPSRLGMCPTHLEIAAPSVWRDCKVSACRQRVGAYGLCGRDVALVLRGARCERGSCSAGYASRSGSGHRAALLTIRYSPDLDAGLAGVAGAASPFT